MVISEVPIGNLREMPGNPRVMPEPEEEQLALCVALNRIKGVWDTEKLRQVTAGLTPAELDGMGFPPEELGLLLEGAQRHGRDTFERVGEEGEEAEHECPSCKYRWSGNPR